MAAGGIYSGRRQAWTTRRHRMFLWKEGSRRGGLPPLRNKDEPPTRGRRLAPRRGCGDRKCYARTLQSVSEPATNKLRRRCSSGIPDLEEPGDLPGVEGMGDPEHEMLEPRLQPLVDRLRAQAADVGGA